MPLVHASILGGLPVVAEVWFSGPDYNGEYDSGCDALYWRKRDGSKGKEVSAAVMDRLERYDSCWQASITEQANDWLGAHCPIRRRNPAYKGYSLNNTEPQYIEEGEYSSDFLLLNPRNAS